MGKRNSKLIAELGGPPPADIGFDNFEVLRAIGRGAFGKVCLVERKDCKTVYAMKYVNKQACQRQDAFKNICAEVELLRQVDHPFVVSLWFTFQDAEDLFIILEPLMGGDLRYHLNSPESVQRLNEEQVRFIVAEMACALDFLRSKRIIHRDVKPDNILLDDAGHAHLTDFNVATRLPEGENFARTLSGTKPYMAPEVFMSAASPSLPGYSYEVDWWSLGVTAYELRTRVRPYDIHSRHSLASVIQIHKTTRVEWPEKWSPEFVKFLQGLLTVRCEKRFTSLASLKKAKLMANVNLASLAAKKLPPPFVPDSQVLNCDPTYELEEMIIESKPLHKKKKRLLRQQTLMTQLGASQTNQEKDKRSSSFDETDIFVDFPCYNREWERYEEMLREKEKVWEEELKRLMEKGSEEESEKDSLDEKSSSPSRQNPPLKKAQSLPSESPPGKSSRRKGSGKGAPKTAPLQQRGQPPSGPVVP